MSSRSSPPTLSGLESIVNRYRSENDIPAAMIGLITPLDLGPGPVTRDGDLYVYELPSGTLEPKSPAGPLGNTLFEIGSITKTFTGTALAWVSSLAAVNMSPDTPIASTAIPGYEDHGFTLPVWKCKNRTTEITFADLADFQPGFPADGTPEGRSFAEYPRLFEWVSNTLKLQAQPGTRYSYSDAAFELLGAALAWLYTNSRGNAASFFYSDLLRAMLSFSRLDMPDTVISLTPEQTGRMAPGHNKADRYEYRNGDWLIKSTMNDMMKWLRFNMGLVPDSPLASVLPVVRRKWAEKRPAGLGWFIHGDDAAYGTLYDKNGSTTGFNSYIVYSLERRTGAVILMNYSKGKADALWSGYLKSYLAPDLP